MSWNLEEAISYYKTQGAPADQSALIGLLKEIQQENQGTRSKRSMLSYGTGFRFVRNP